MDTICAADVTFSTERWFTEMIVWQRGCELPFSLAVRPTNQ